MKCGLNGVGWGGIIEFSLSDYAVLHGLHNINEISPKLRIVLVVNTTNTFS